MAIEKRFYKLSQEILNAAKNRNDTQIEQKTLLQEQLAQVLAKRRKAEIDFDEKRKKIIFGDDEVYKNAKKTGDQELLNKFHNRNLTREEYVNAAKRFNINLWNDDYYSSIPKVADLNFEITRIEGQYGHFYFK